MQSCLPGVLVRIWLPFNVIILSHEVILFQHYDKVLEAGSVGFAAVAPPLRAQVANSIAKRSQLEIHVHRIRTGLQTNHIYQYNDIVSLCRWNAIGKLDVHKYSPFDCIRVT